MDFQTLILPNGIRLLHIHNTGHVAHLAVYINAGTRDEEEHESGLAHFIEHSIFKGTTTRKAYHVLTRLETVGGDLNAFTTKEETCVYASFLDEHFLRALELISDILIHSTFPDKELKKEKDVILEEINSYKDTPSEEIYDVLEENVYKGHALARNILGNPDDLKKLTRRNIQEFIERNYTGENMVVCTSGNFDFNKISRLVEKFFDQVPVSRPGRKRKKFSRYEPFSLHLPRTTFQTHCMLGNIAYDRRNPKRYPLFLLNNILGGPAMNSRLNLAVRERHGYAYSVESVFLPYTDTGIFSVYLGTDNGNLDRSLALIGKEMEKLRSARLGGLQFSQAKKQLIGQIEIANESRLNYLLAAGKSYLHDNRLEPPEEILRNIDIITGEQILDVANEIFNPDHLSRLIFQNQSNGDPLIR
ncbi:MAG: insulinase family protein [Bacteroidales bacterium]|nr:insulinase family protein [Bacteroidales bacterium]